MTMIQVKQHGTEPEVGVVTAQFDSTLRPHTEPPTTRHQQYPLT
jgi:hypothetical protein